MIKHIFYAVVLFIVLVWSITSFSTRSFAHEGKGFTHMKTSSGSIIGQKDCGAGLTMWFQDLEEPFGEVDTCTLVFWYDGDIHRKNAGDPVLVEDYKGDMVLECLCPGEEK